MDDVQVASDAEAMVTVRLGARVQVIAGQYDAEFNVPAAALVSLLAAGRDATVAQQLPAGDAAFLLDALEAHLTGVGDTDALLALAALQVARTTGLEAAFAQHLVDEGAGPSAALGSALSFVSSQVGLTLAGALTIEANGDTSFTSSSLVLAGPMGSYAGLPAADGALPALSFVTELDLVGAVVMFDPVVISLPLGANLEAIVADAVALLALGSWGALSGAGSAAGFSNPAVNGVCDEVCRATVFASAASALRDAWFDTLGRDTSSVTLTLSGGAVASDPDGDFRANALDAELGGDAVVGVTTLPIVGTLSATRSAAPVLP
ncbi:MAG: hypothetical protein IPG17_02920 [Sandaracinaceae bacterium]|nr:hypothetical protein [Sandaracinaceae bacterium]